MWRAGATYQCWCGHIGIAGSGPGSALRRSTDGGDTWSRARRTVRPLRTSGRIGLDISASNPNVVHAVVEGFPAGEGRSSVGRRRRDVAATQRGTNQRGNGPSSDRRRPKKLMDVPGRSATALESRRMTAGRRSRATESLRRRRIPDHHATSLDRTRTIRGTVTLGNDGGVHTSSLYHDRCSWSYI